MVRSPRENIVEDAGQLAHRGDLWMPYAPAIKVKGGTTVYLAGVTAASVYQHAAPHLPQQLFRKMPVEGLN